MTESNHSHHDHDHHHHDGSGSTEEPKLDNPGDIAVQQTFKTGFFLLRLVMVLLVIIWLDTGRFDVGKGEHAIEFFLGKIRERNGEKVLSSGMYWTLPFPFSRVVKIKTQQEYSTLALSALDPIEVDPAQETENDPIIKRKRPYQVTNDQNIIHTGWSISYRIKDLENFVINIYKEGDDSDGVNKNFIWVRHVEKILASVFLPAVTDESRRFAAVDILLGKNLLTDAVRTKVQKELDLMKSGIEITGLRLVDASAPSSVGLSFLNVFQAKEVKRQVTTRATKEKERILSEIQSDVNRMHLMAQTERQNLKGQMEVAVSQFNALREIFKNTPGIRKQYLESMYYKVLGEVLAKTPIEYIGDSERITLRANAFQPEEDKQGNDGTSQK